MNELNQLQPKADVKETEIPKQTVEDFIKIPEEIKQKAEVLATDDSSETIKQLYIEIARDHKALEGKFTEELYPSLPYIEIMSLEAKSKQQLYVLVAKTLTNHILKKTEDENLKKYLKALFEAQEFNLQLCAIDPKYIGGAGLDRFFADKLPFEDEHPENMPRFRAKGRGDVLKKYYDQIEVLKTAFLSSQPTTEKIREKFQVIHDILRKMHDEMYSTNFKDIVGIDSHSDEGREATHTIGTVLATYMSWLNSLMTYKK